MPRHSLWPFFVIPLAMLASCAPAIKIDPQDRPFVQQVTSADAPTAAGARRQLAEQHPEWPSEIRQAILAGEVTGDMAPEHVVAAWGIPSSSGRPWLISDGRDYWWRYNRTNPCLSVWFYDSKVTSVRPDSDDANLEAPRGEHGYTLEWIAR